MADTSALIVLKKVTILTRGNFFEVELTRNITFFPCGNHHICRETSETITFSVAAGASAVQYRGKASAADKTLASFVSAVIVWNLDRD